MRLHLHVYVCRFMYFYLYILTRCWFLKHTQFKFSLHCLFYSHKYIKSTIHSYREIISQKLLKFHTNSINCMKCKNIGILYIYLIISCDMNWCNVKHLMWSRFQCLHTFSAVVLYCEWKNLLCLFLSWNFIISITVFKLWIRLNCSHTLKKCSSWFFSSTIKMLFFFSPLRLNSWSWSLMNIMTNVIRYFPLFYYESRENMIFRCYCVTIFNWLKCEILLVFFLFRNYRKKRW